MQMTAQRIYHALQDFEGEGDLNAARAGFMEWALCLPDGCHPPHEARRALLHLEALPRGTQASQMFVGLLRDASADLPAPKRRGGRRRLLH